MRTPLSLITAAMATQGHSQHRRRGEEVHDSAFRREAECKPCRTRAREVLCIHAHARTARLGDGAMKATS